METNNDFWKKFYHKSGVSRITSAITYKKDANHNRFNFPDSESDFEKDSPGAKSSSKAGKSNLSEPPPPSTPLPQDINTNKEFIYNTFNYPDNKDIVIRELKLGGSIKSFIVYLEGMADRTTINNFILRPLLSEKSNEIISNSKDTCKLDTIFNEIIETSQTKKVTSKEDVISEILSGNTGIYVDGCNSYVFNETKGFDKRGVERPQLEGVVKGPQEAFNETLRTNITLIRKIIKNNDLTTEFYPVGEKNKNLCAIMYMKGIANGETINEVKRRIKNIKADFIMGDGMLEQFIEDSPMSFVPTVLTTERPDRTASHLMEGRVAVIIEGTPAAIITPVSIHSLFHTPEDSNLRWQFGSALRLIRFMAAFIAVLLPGIYIALTNYHSEMIPADLLIAIAKAKENVPLPTILEIILMELSFELIREAGIRIPGMIGNTIGIIGALILGQAAVSANLVSPILIIIIAFTGLGNFAIPNFNLAFSARVLRFFFIFAGSILGFYGIALGIIIGITLLSTTNTFNVPYFSGTAPKVRRSFDLFLRWPIWKQELRPDIANPGSVRSQEHISRKWAFDKGMEDSDE